MASSVPARNWIATTFAENIIQHAPGRVLPNILIDVKRTGYNISDPDKILPFFPESTEINGFEISNGCCPTDYFPFMHYGFAGIIYQLKFSIIVLYIHYCCLFTFIAI